MLHENGILNQAKNKKPLGADTEGLFAEMCFCRTLNMLTFVRQNCIAAASGDRAETATATTSGEMERGVRHIQG